MRKPDKFELVKKMENLVKNGLCLDESVVFK
jgi:hypothetical protein